MEITTRMATGSGSSSLQGLLAQKSQLERELREVYYPHPFLLTVSRARMLVQGDDATDATPLFLEST